MRRFKVTVRPCILEPSAELRAGAELVRSAVEAAVGGKLIAARELLDALRGEVVNEHWVLGRRVVADAMTVAGVADARRSALPHEPAPPLKRRARDTAETLKRTVFTRDGYHCRYCEIPLIDKRARVWLTNQFPDTFFYRSKVTGEHHPFAAALTASHDHVVPIQRGGADVAANLVTACRPCQFLKGARTIESLGVADPRARPPLSGWDGGVRLLRGRKV